MEVSENRGTFFGGPDNKDPTIWGAILGSLIFGSPHMEVRHLHTRAHPMISPVGNLCIMFPV